MFFMKTYISFDNIINFGVRVMKMHHHIQHTDLNMYTKNNEPPRFLFVDICIYLPISKTNSINKDFLFIFD